MNLLGRGVARISSWHFQLGAIFNDLNRPDEFRPVHFARRKQIRSLCSSDRGARSVVRAVLPVRSRRTAALQDLAYELVVASLRAAGIETEMVVAKPGDEATLAGFQAECPVLLVYVHVSSQEAMGVGRLVLDALACSSPRPLLFIGGSFASSNPLSVLKQIEHLDAIVVGEPEQTIIAVVRKVVDDHAWWQEPGLWYRHQGVIARTLPRSPIEDLDLLPMAAPDLINPGNRTRGRQVLVGRGCDSNCSYCRLQVPYRETFPLRQHFWRSKSPRVVVDEIEYLYRFWQIERFELNSFVFFGYDERGTDLAEGMAHEILTRGISIRFSFVTHPGHLRRNVHLLPCLLRAGLEKIHLGVDSILDRARVLYHLPFGMEDIYASLDALHEHAVRFRTHYIFYDPYTSLQEIAETLAFFRQIRLLYSHLEMSYNLLLHHQILNTILRLEPQTPVVERLKRDGLLVREGTIEKAPLARFRDLAVGRFFRLHRRFNQEILRNVAPLVFQPALEKQFPDLALFLLDALQVILLRLENDPGAEESEILSALRLWTLGVLGPVYLASQERGSPSLQRQELVDTFFSSTRGMRKA